MALIERKAEDPNFSHTLSLLAPCAAWAESIRPGHSIDDNDRNMIALPVEIALAFVNLHAKEESDLGAACRVTLELLSRFQSPPTKPKSKSKKPRAKRPPKQAKLEF